MCRPSGRPSGGRPLLLPDDAPVVESTLLRIRCSPCGRPSRPCRSAFVSPRTRTVAVPTAWDTMPKIKNILPGSPEPLGPTVKDDGINFAIHSAGATRLELLLFDNIADQRPTQVIPLSPETHRTGDIWHIFVEGLPNRTLYNIRADGPYNPSVDGTRFNVTKTLLDPYAPAVTGDFYWQSGDALGYDNSDPDDPDRHLRPSDGRQRGGAPRCVAYRSDFDWEGDRHPDIPIEESIIYEVNVRGFTRHHSSESDLARDLPRLHREDPLPEGAGDHRRRAAAGHGVRPVRRPLPRPDDRRAPGQRLGLQHGRLLRPRVALQLLRQARRAGRRVQDARPRAAQARHRGHPRRRLQPHARGEPLRADGQLQGPGQQHLLHAGVRPRSSTTTSPAAATR